MHANCPRANLAFKDALKEAHVFLDMLNDGLQQLVAYYNSARACLKCLREVALELGVVVSKFGQLLDHCCVAFAFHTLQSM